MKPSEFYSTIRNYPVGNTSGQFTEQQTNSVYSIYTETGSVSEEAYWLGWIKKENLPLNMQHNHWVIEGEGESKTLKFINDTDLANFPCGYVKRDSPSYMYSTRFITDGVARSYNNSVWWTYFLNDLHPEYSAAVESSSYGNTQIIAYVYYKNAGVIIPRGYNELFTKSIGFSLGSGYTLKDCIDFLEGNKTITITSDFIYQGYYTFDITIDDDLKTLGYKEFTSNEDDNITMMYILSNIFLPHVVYRNGNSNGLLLSQFAAKITWTDEDNETSGEYNVTNGHNYYNIIAAIINDAMSRYDDNSGAEGEFNYNELMNMGNDDYIINGNIFVANVYNRVRFHNIRNAVDLLKSFSLIYRVDTSSSNTPVSSYVEGVTYATDVSSDDEFLARLKTGNISDDEFRDGLRYWQYSSITNNDFDEDDVPPYEPPEPPTEGEESGDRIPPQIRYFTGTTNFITQYAMKNVHVSTFGHLLWTSWVDALSEPTDMWKNFVLAGQSFFNTGSVNVSDAIQFIVSLKLFPFNIPNTTLDSLTNSVIIGTGAFPIEVENIYRINSPLIYLDFGSVVIPRPYGDFRDYDNMKISIVLPYCGTSELNPGDVIGKTLRCRYAIDLQSGSCTAMVTTWDSEGELYPVAQLDGQIGCTIPLTATNTGQLASRVLTDASNVASLVHDKTFGRIESGFKDMSSFLSGGESFSGDWGAASLSPLSIKPDVSGLANALSRPAISCPSISGGAGLASFIQPKAPFVQMRYGLYDEPGNYNHAVGKPSTGNGTLSSYTGYVVCSNVDVSSLTCHTDEKAAIKAALESGVYV